MQVEGLVVSTTPDYFRRRIMEVQQDIPHFQTGYQTSKVGNPAIRVERFQDVDPPTDLGRAAAVDREFASRNGDVEAIPSTFSWQGRGWLQRPRFNPLYNDPMVIEMSRQNEYDWGFASPFGQVEYAIMYQRNRVTAPKQALTTVPVLNSENSLKY